jgi:hypothetical protein
MKKLLLLALVFALRCEDALGLGVDYPPGMRLLSPTNWPSGLAKLRDSQRWVHGYCFGFAEDNFFYAGDTASFRSFLTNYASLPIASHTLTLHRGSGTAKSPWNHGEGVRCDWKMYIIPSWRLSAYGKPAAEAQRIIRENPGYNVSLDLWLHGGVNFSEVNVPANVTVVPAGAK